MITEEFSNLSQNFLDITDYIPLNNVAITEHPGYPGKIVPSQLTVIENFLVIIIS